MKKRQAQPVFFVLGASAVIAAARKVKERLQLSRAKHPSLTGHARIAQRLAALLPFYEFGDREFFRSDDAPDEIVSARRDGFMRLAVLYRSDSALQGRFEAALPLIGHELIRVDEMIADRFALKDAARAFARAAERGALKVLLAG